MRLASGTRLGRYEIAALLGVGGMGEVYRATDPRLKRSVAIKVLSSAAAADAELCARVRREAQAVAALKHPHICVLYDVADVDGVDYLVMEYLEGETLAARLQRGPLPFTEVLRYAVQITSALEAAHREGIVHRDLKPGNIMLTATGAKLLDFGLAKRTVLAADVGPGAPTAMPATARASILGTLGYMAPEQLRGRDADTRSDLFALGATLFELATGRPAFGGSSEADVLAAVMSAEPDASALDAPHVPVLFKRIVLKCLAKNPELRWQTVHDLADALSWVESEPPGATARGAPVPRLRRAAWIVGALALAGAAGFAVDALRGSAVDSTPLRVSIVAPAGVVFSERDITRHPQFALSPDGSRIAFIAERRGEARQLWVRALESGVAQPLSGTENASGPFWSPDGDSLAFFARGKLWRVPARGGATLELADVAVDVASGTWGDDGTILFAPRTAGGLFRVPSGGGPVTPVTDLAADGGETSHRWPQFLPDGRFLYFGRSSLGGGTYLAEFGASNRAPVIETTANVVYAESGHLLFERDGSLMSQRFDSASGELVGEPTALGDRILGLRGPSYLPLSVARNDLLAYWQGPQARTELQWFDRSGRPLGVIEMPERADAPALSPDATQLLVTQRSDANQTQLWRVDLANGLTSQLTFGGGVGRFGIWSPDGTTTVFSTLAERGASALALKPVSGAGAEVIVTGPGEHYALFPDDWSRDGQWILYSATRAAWDVFALDVPSATARPVVATPANDVQAHLSPDGRWLAYVSDESGAWEVYVQPFPEGEGRWRISAGGAQPLWRSDGRELFYLGADGRLMTVAIGAGPGFDHGVPSPLFQTRVPPMLAPFRVGYSVTPDGQRFLLNNVVPDVEPVAITLVRNWQPRP